ncbi:AlpA family phage regulatory protein [Nitrosomonas sp. HPC101]|uniref:helix-turn-helix domain-containing protein n=1 Tax=Nitrosomonas sp. HPC101 TaxID=1658667 RepID=UPI0013709E5F|nr:helix-turn-helix domain-containing protein [Nitrosomonas sp. HPC101]MXS85302.1 AlpA family phage regulatory protein [Nitrosomonas sp. HPC101]
MDIVEDMISRVMDVLNIRSGSEPAARLNEVEQQIRQAWGGTEPYILRCRRRDKMREQALQTLAKGLPLKEVVRKTGISRAQVYRLLKLKK